MSFKTTVWLFVAVCLVGCAIWIMEDHVASTRERGLRQERLLPMGVEAIERLAISRADLHAVCTRRDGMWYMEKPLSARADGERIDRVLAALESMRRIETITAAQRRAREVTLDDYGLADPATRLAIESQRARVVLFLGTRAPLGDHLYVKLVQDDAVFATQPDILRELPERMRDLRDRSLMPGDPFRVSRLEIQWIEGGFTQLARVDGAWRIQQPFEARADDARIEAMLQKLYATRIAEFVWDQQAPADNGAGADVLDGTLASRAEAYGLLPDDAPVRIGVWTRGSATGRELLLGNMVEEDGDAGTEKVYARFREGESIVTLDRALRDLFAVVAADLRDRNLFAVEADAVRVVRIREGDRYLELRGSDDGGWMVDNPVHWRADDEVANTFVRRLVRLRAEVFLESVSTNLAGMGLAPPRMVVGLGEEAAAVGDDTSSNGRPPRETDVAGSEQHDVRGALCIGGVRGTGRTVYARFADEDLVFTIDREAVRELGHDLSDPLVFRDRTMLSVNPDNLKRIVLTTEGSKQTVVRSANRDWVPEPAASSRLNMEALANLLFHVANLRAIRIECHNPEGLEGYGLDQNAVVLTLGLSGEEGIQKNLRMGFRAGTEGVYAMIQGQDVVFVMDDRIFRNLTTPLVQTRLPATTPLPTETGEP